MNTPQFICTLPCQWILVFSNIFVIKINAVRCLRPFFVTFHDWWFDEKNLPSLFLEAIPVQGFPQNICLEVGRVKDIHLLLYNTKLLFKLFVLIYNPISILLKFWLSNMLANSWYNQNISIFANLGKYISLKFSFSFP